MESEAKRKRNLMFLAHLWACVPLLVLWLLVPSANTRISAADFQQVTAFSYVILAYLPVRTWLIVKHSTHCDWDFVFPPIDIALISILIGLGHLGPLSNIGLLYLFPLAQAASTLNLKWSVAVATMVLVGAALTTQGLSSVEPFNTFFRYYFFFVLASLITMLARSSAELREQLGIARDRNRLAMEIHDGVQGHLMTITKQIELVGELFSIDPTRGARIAKESQATARMAADELRYVVNRMRSPSLAGGFIPALQGFVHSICGRHDLNHTFEIEGEEVPLPPEVEQAAFRIAQEALTNVIRHAGANQVHIRIAYKPESLEVSISDNGSGFDAGAGSEGIEGMRTRASELNGRLTLDSSAGTRVVASLPLKETR